MPRPRQHDDDELDELDELPPLDDGDDPTAGAPEGEEPLDELRDEHEGRDDQEAGDMVDGDALDEMGDEGGDREGGDEAGVEGEELEHEVGDESFRLEAGDADGPGLDGDDDGIWIGDAGADDGGAEGLGDDDASGLGELPTLDGDDGESADIDVESPMHHDAQHAPLPPWRDVAYTVVPGLSLRGPALSAIDACAGHVVALGDEVVWLDPTSSEPSRAASPWASSHLVHVAIEPSAPNRVAVGREGEVRVGASARSALGRPSTVHRVSGLRQLVWGGALHALLDGGRVQSLGAQQATAEMAGEVSSRLARHGARVRGLIDASGARVLADLEDSDAGRDLEPMPRGVGAEAKLIACTEGAVAVASPGCVWLVRGRSIEAHDELSGAVALVFLGEGREAALAALLVRDDGARAYLAVVQGDEGPQLVAELSPPWFDLGETGDAPCAMAYDSARRVVLIASHRGLVCLSPGPRGRATTLR